MIKRALSTVFWAFVTVSSIVQSPVAVMIWVLMVAFDRRLVVRHRFTCFWASGRPLLDMTHHVPATFVVV